MGERRVVVVVGGGGGGGGWGWWWGVVVGVGVGVEKAVSSFKLVSLIAGSACTTVNNF